MKRITFLTAGLSLVIALVIFLNWDGSARAQRTRLYRADTGVVTLGPNQKLRVTLGSNILATQQTIQTENRKIIYTQGACSDGVCSLLVDQDSSTNIQLPPGGGAFIDAFQDISQPGVRVVVTSNNPNLVVASTVVDDAGHVVALMSAGQIDTW